MGAGCYSFFRLKAWCGQDAKTTVVHVKDAHTLEEVGKEFGVTRERIRQIEAKALEKIRLHEKARRLKSY